MIDSAFSGNDKICPVQDGVKPNGVQNTINARFELCVQKRHAPCSHSTGSAGAGKVCHRNAQVFSDHLLQMVNELSHFICGSNLRIHEVFCQGQSGVWRGGGPGDL